MKKYFMLIAAATTVLVVSCHKKEAPAPVVDPTEVEDNTPVPIQFGVNNVPVKSVVTTKAAVTASNWGGTALKIYAFEKTAGAIDVSTPYISNVGIAVPASPNESNPVTPLDNQGLAYTYGIGNQVYSFYGYYVDNAVATPVPTAADGALTLGVPLDGTDDIMAATTDRDEDYATRIKDFSYSSLYSARSARGGVIPNLVFKHMLSRFVIYTKYSGSDAANYNKISINALTVNAINSGTLTIATNAEDAPSFANGTEKSDIPVEYVVADLPRLPGQMTQAADETHPNGYTKFGEILVAPEKGQDANQANVSIYPIKLTVQKYDGGSPTNNPVGEPLDPSPLTIDFNDVVDALGNPLTNKYAEAGKQYNIFLTIYGVEDIQVKVTLTEWEYGGDDEIDPDKEDGYETILSITNPVTTSGDPLDIVAGSSQQITWTAECNGADVSAAATFKSSNSNVATVSVAGLIEAKSVGTAKIYVTIPEVVDGTTNKITRQSTSKVVYVNVTAATPVVTAATTAATWGFESGYTGNIATISGSAALLGTEIKNGSWTYSVAANDLLEVDASTGVVTLKAAAAAPAAATPVTFTATLAARAGYYATASGEVTITVLLPNALTLAADGAVTLDGLHNAITAAPVVTANTGALSISKVEKKNGNGVYEAFDNTAPIFTLDADKKLVVTNAPNVDAEYRLTIHDAGDATHGAKELPYVLTVTAVGALPQGVITVEGLDLTGMTATGSAWDDDCVVTTTGGTLTWESSNAELTVTNTSGNNFTIAKTTALPAGDYTITFNSAADATHSAAEPYIINIHVPEA